RVPASTLSNWKTKNSMPLEVIAEFAQKNNSDLNWLVFDQEKSSELASDARMALLAFNDLDDRKKLEAIAFMTGLKTSSPQTGAITQHVSGSKNNVVGNGHIRIEKND
ncbi:TPA: helix-turn-helix domain-containing protein, partial [Haemophilus influenzae]